MRLFQRVHWRFSLPHAPPSTIPLRPLVLLARSRPEASTPLLGTPGGTSRPWARSRVPVSGLNAGACRLSQIIRSPASASRGGPLIPRGTDSSVCSGPCRGAGGQQETVSRCSSPRPLGTGGLALSFISPRRRRCARRLASRLCIAAWAQPFPGIPHFEVPERRYRRGDRLATAFACKARS